MHTNIDHCRICGYHVSPIIDLGDIALSGVFPATTDEAVESGPLALVKCAGTAPDACGLVQLDATYEMDKLYGDNYGYRSGLNRSMVAHLADLCRLVSGAASPADGDLIVDIGSNDSTLLQQYPAGRYRLVGVDPTGGKFKSYYPPHIDLIEDFFPSPEFNRRYQGGKAKIITSISMFYDLPDPLGFAQAIFNHLDDEGIWALEQSYLPTMLEMNSYDTICHEHLEYYSLRQIKYIADRIGFKIIDVKFNDVNGGSFLVIAAKSKSKYRETAETISRILEQERSRGLDASTTYADFMARIESHRAELMKFLSECKAAGKAVLGYGASTKGNVLLQYCGITPEHLPYIVEVNQYKFGKFTPGTRIPIRSDEMLKKDPPDYLLVLPWHFKAMIIEKEKAFRAGGGRLVFPLPRLEVV